MLKKYKDNLREYYINICKTHFKARLMSVFAAVLILASSTLVADPINFDRFKEVKNQPTFGGHKAKMMFYLPSQKSYYLVKQGGVYGSIRSSVKTQDLRSIYPVREVLAAEIYLQLLPGMSPETLLVDAKKSKHWLARDQEYLVASRVLSGFRDSQYVSDATESYINEETWQPMLIALLLGENDNKPEHYGYYLDTENKNFRGVKIDHGETFSEFFKEHEEWEQILLGKGRGILARTLGSISNERKLEFLKELKERTDWRKLQTIATSYEKNYWKAVRTRFKNNKTKKPSDLVEFIGEDSESIVNLLKMRLDKSIDTLTQDKV